MWTWTGKMNFARENLQVLVVLLLVLAALLLGGCGITAPRSNAGFADLDSPGMAETDRTMALSLGPAALRFAAAFLDDEPETQALLRSLDGVRIRIYEVHGDHQKIENNFERMGRKLVSDGWNPVMLVSEDGELVKMFAKPGGKQLKGLTIVSADHKEVMVVNIMGDLDPKHYSDVMVALDIDDTPVVRVASVD
jgi:hypothetical protein